MQRTVLTLIDYSKAYDRVWRDALLLKMHQKGVPAHLVKWIQAWLANRVNWVTFEGEKSKNKLSSRNAFPKGRCSRHCYSYFT